MLVNSNLINYQIISEISNKSIKTIELNVEYEDSSI
jgi:hypothetical protein